MALEWIARQMWYSFFKNKNVNFYIINILIYWF